MQIKTFFWPAFSSLLMFSCQTNTNSSPPLSDQNSIERIELSNYGGMMGYRDLLIVDQDSIIYSYSSVESNHKETRIASENTAKEWQTLIGSFSLSDFNSVRNGASNLAFDGTDQKIKIVTETTADSIINGKQDIENYPKIKNLVNRLNTFYADKK